MNCSCGERPVYFRRYSGQLFCKTCFNQYFEKKVIDTIRKYTMVNRGDRVGVGISGGKDSTALLHVLNKLSSKLEIALYPLIVDEGIEGYRESGLEAAKKTCDSFSQPLMVSKLEEEFGYSIDSLRSNGDLKPCSYCGILRRKILNQKSRELELNSIATGHNLDDEAQAIMMNYVSGDIERLHRLNGITVNQDLIKRIKPLSRLPEKEVMLYALFNDLIVSNVECPYAKENYRTDIRNFLNELEIKRPGVKFSIVNGWERLVKIRPPRINSVRTCIVCGHPSARDICRPCELIEEIKIKMSGVN